jgi:aryl-alcohol dehydrogenase
MAGVTTSARDVLAAVSRDPASPVTLERLVLGPPGPDEVLVRVTHAGVCHTDLSCHEGLIPTRKPVVLGHEGAGVVEALGEGVTSLEVGAPVILSLMSCGVCRGCVADGIYCERSMELNILGGGPGGGVTYVDSDVKRHFFGQSSFATYATAHVRNVVAVPEGLALESVAPLGCGIMTGAGAVVNALRVRPGASVAVFGAGAVGLAAVQAAVTSGATRIVAVDLLAPRLRTASRLGASDVVDGSETDPVTAIRDLTGGGADYVIEASGHPRALQQAIDSVGRRGTCAIVGAGHGRVEFDTNALRVKGASIRGVSMGDANPRVFLPYLMEEMRRGALRLDELVTTYDFADISTAFEDAHAGRAIKPVLVMPS